MMICITPVLADAPADPLPQMSGETWHVAEGQNLDTTRNDLPCCQHLLFLFRPFPNYTICAVIFLATKRNQASTKSPAANSDIARLRRAELARWIGCKFAPVYLHRGMPKTDNLAILRSMTAGCTAASEAIAETTLALNKFVREFRESRAEIDAISTELHSVDGILALLRYDAASVPIPLAEQTPAVLSTCLGLINELGSCVSVLNRPGLSKGDKRSRWLDSRPHVDDVRQALGEYKLALSLAVDLVGVYAVFCCHPFVAWTDSYLLGSNPSQTKGTDQTCRG
jgi:hypothetical protein